MVLADEKGISPLHFHFPGSNSYHTRDLFKPHPSKAGLWKFHGRIDDIVVLSNGEKFNPVPIESTMQGCSLVTGALVVGQGRSQAALLIELKKGSDGSNLEEKLWSLVQKSNQLVPGQGRIVRDKILFCSDEKPFPRAGKGTIIRKLAERLYEHEIIALYSQKAPNPSPITLKASFKLEDVKDFVWSILKSTYFSGQVISDQDDLYMHGLDSLGTTELTTMLRAGLGSYRHAAELSWIDARVVYENPSIEQLSMVLTNFLNTGTVPTYSDGSRKISLLVEKYTPKLEQTPFDTTQAIDLKCLRITLIGATGNLGSHLLKSLLNDSRFSKIHCLSRSRPTAESSKLDFLEVNYENPQLGLTDTILESIALDSDIIFLNAWKTDFNQSLQSFENNLRMVNDVIRAVAKSPNRPRIVFISSLAAVSGWRLTHTNGTAVPEKPMTEEYGNPSISIGYGQSKLVGERILARAATLYNIPVSILRVGQVAGHSLSDSKVLWPVHEWFPSTIKTSKSLGFLPQLGSIDWIPVDIFVKTVEELIHHQTTIERFSQMTYNVVNTQPVPWDTLVDPVLERYPGMTVIPLSQWLEKVKKNKSSKDESVDVNFLQFLAFYDQITTKSTLKFHTENFTAASKTAADLGPITAVSIKTWIEQWGL